MRTIQVNGGYYKIKVGHKDLKVYVADLKMIAKRRKTKNPPVPNYMEEDESSGKLMRKSSDSTEPVSIWKVGLNSDFCIW